MICLKKLLSCICTNNTNNNNNNTNNNNIKKFDLYGIKGNFYVESVHDGDTITILIPIKLHIYSMISKNYIDYVSNSNVSNTIYYNKVKLRLIGIDTPEIKPKKDITNRDEHIIKAKLARDFLSNQILNKIIYVEIVENDKYGRPLGNIYQNNINLNNLMIEKGFAKKYDGKSKDIDF